MVRYDRRARSSAGKRVFIRVDFNVPLDEKQQDHRRHAHPRGAADHQARPEAGGEGDPRVAPRPAEGRTTPKLSLEPAARGWPSSLGNDEVHARRRLRGRRRREGRPRSARRARSAAREPPLPRGRGGTTRASRASSPSSATSTSTTRSAPCTARTRRRAGAAARDARCAAGFLIAKELESLGKLLTEPRAARSWRCSAAPRSPTRSRSSRPAPARRRAAHRRRHGQHVPHGAGQGDGQEPRRGGQAGPGARGRSRRRKRLGKSSCSRSTTSCAGTRRRRRRRPTRGDGASIPAERWRSTSARRRATLFAEHIRAAKTVFWNGPDGPVRERRRSPRHVGGRPQAMAGQRDAFTVVGGGDSAAAVQQMRAGGQDDRTSRPAAAPRSSSSKARSCRA